MENEKESKTVYATCFIKMESSRDHDGSCKLMSPEQNQYHQKILFEKSLNFM